ncbi:MAG: hypothetical protein SPL40_08545 [Erysipelotrichaceae bacterium]|nr:hypothetical protein [Erysipelotrichaceae bacterium]
MKNSLIDLNNHLFAELERLGDEDLKGDELKAEIERANMISSVARAAIDNANTVLRAAKFQEDRLDINNRAPELLLGSSGGVK